jgi:hypothetical protein
MMLVLCNKMLHVCRDGQTGRPVRPGPGEARPVLGPACQARLGNRASPSRHAGLNSCLSPARSGPKRAGPGRLARKSGLYGLVSTF